MPERRRARRYEIGLPVEFDGGEGITRDVSASGAFFLTSTPREVGQAIRCRILLKTPTSGAERLDVEGRVLRVEPLGGRYGVAVQFHALRSELPLLS